ncbi:hypothetical protein CB1_000216040 [Camelus ferus]|nr:hypothetical protein CB1_000216040 [Camelus ferus]
MWCYPAALPSVCRAGPRASVPAEEARNPSGLLSQGSEHKPTAPGPGILGRGDRKGAAFLSQLNLRARGWPGGGAGRGRCFGRTLASPEISASPQCHDADRAVLPGGGTVKKFFREKKRLLSIWAFGHVCHSDALTFQSSRRRKTLVEENEPGENGLT